MEEVTISVEKDDHTLSDIIAPTNMGLSLLEILKAYDFPVPGICKGTAFCATCHVYITKGIEGLPVPSEIEQKILNMLPNANPASRLSCRVKITESSQGITLQIPPPPAFY